MTTSIDPWKLFRVVLALAAISLLIPSHHALNRPNGDGTSDYYPDHGCSMMHDEDHSTSPH